MDDSNDVRSRSDLLREVESLKKTCEERNKKIEILERAGKAKDKRIENQALEIYWLEKSKANLMVMLMSLRAMVRQLKEVSTIDYLTNLLNLRGVEERFSAWASETLRREDVRFVLMYFDLDGFKKINDTEGHAVGDEILKETARATKDNVRIADLASRLGGDEFEVLLLGATMKQSLMVAARLVRHMKSIGFGVSGLHVGLSIGLVEVLIPQGSSPEHVDMIFRESKKEADRRMYLSKAKGGGITYKD